MDFLLSFFLLIIGLIGLVFWFRTPFIQYLTYLLDNIIARIEERNKIKQEEARKKFIEQKDLLTETIKDLKLKIEESEKERIKETENLRTTIAEHSKTAHLLASKTEKLNKKLSNNQERGSYGEEIAEDLLKMIGFVQGIDYVLQKKLDTSNNKPDITVFLPDQTKINIDVKFPFPALEKYHETEDEEQKKKHLNEFQQDIKRQLKSITSKDYINFEENTVDFVVMMIPNESIFSFIYDKCNEELEYAKNNKVIMCGPFGFIAILRMIRRSFDIFKYQKNLHSIIQLIEAFSKEYEKFNESLDSLGGNIEKAFKDYNDLSNTRKKKLVGIVNKIKSGEAELDSYVPSMLENHNEIKNS